MEYAALDEVAVCNLAWISLPNFVQKEGGVLFYDFEKLRKVSLDGAKFDGIAHTYFFLMVWLFVNSYSSKTSVI